MIPVPGIYMIRHCSGRTYIGSSHNVEARCIQHVQRLSFGNHTNRALQSDWTKDGPDAFTMTLLDPLPLDDAALGKAEQQWCDRLLSAGISLYGSPVAGRPQSQPSLPRLRQRRLRVSLSQRELAKLSGVAASTIARIESGEQAHPSTARRLAQALGCQPFELMEAEL